MHATTPERGGLARVRQRGFQPSTCGWGSVVTIQKEKLATEVNTGQVRIVERRGRYGMTKAPTVWPGLSFTEGALLLLHLSVTDFLSAVKRHAYAAMSMPARSIASVSRNSSGS